MRYFFCALIGILLSGPLWGQEKIDSLWKEYDKSNIDTQRCKILNKIVVASYYTDINKCKIFNDSLLKISKGVSRKYEAEACLMKGIFYRKERKLERTKEMYDKCLRIAQEINDVPLQTKTYSCLATFYAHQTNFDSSVTLHKRAIRLNQSVGRNDANIGSYLNLGNHYTRKQQYALSNLYLKKALRIADSTNNYQIGTNVLSNIALCHINLNEFDKAEYYLNEAYKKAIALDNKLALLSYYRIRGELAMKRYQSPNRIIALFDSAKIFARQSKNVHELQYAHLMVGEALIRNKEYARAKLQLDTSLQICKETNNKEWEAMAQLNLGRLAILQNNIPLGVQLIKKAKKQIGLTQQSYPEHFSDIANSLASAGEYKLAFEELSDYYSLNDSVYLENSALRIAALDEKYNAEKKEKEIIAYRAQQAKLSNSIKLLGGSSAALLLLLGIFGYYYRRNKKQKDRIVALQRELHHRVDNNLAIVDEFIERTKRTVHQPELLNELSNLQTRVGSINQVHRMLYQEDDISSINLKQYVQSLGEQVRKAFRQDSVEIEVKIPDAIQATTDKSVPLGLIINEFITNSFKHAFKGIKNPQVYISARENQESLFVELKDNGIGFNKEKILDNSYGQDIMSLLAKQMKASFELNGSNGVLLILQIPK